MGEDIRPLTAGHRRSSTTTKKRLDCQSSKSQCRVNVPNPDQVALREPGLGPSESGQGTFFPPPSPPLVLLSNATVTGSGALRHGVTTSTTWTTTTVDPPVTVDGRADYGPDVVSLCRGEICSRRQLLVQDFSPKRTPV